MKPLPLWLKILLGTAVLAILVAASQLLLWLDKMGASKFDL